MKDEAKIAAVVRRHGTRVSVEWDMAEAAAALDDECARLWERVAEVERERDEARAQLAAVRVDVAHAQGAAVTANELLPCPFCGRAPVVEESVHSFSRELTVTIKCQTLHAIVSVTNPDGTGRMPLGVCYGRPYSKDLPTAGQRAVEQWNTRWKP